MGSFISAIVSQRPNRLIPNNEKNEKYHLDWAKYATMAGWQSAMRSQWVERTLRNERFYRNEQWKTQEDVDTFLKDQSGQDRNRIMFTMNMIRQLVEQYRGHALTMDINFRAENISPFSKTRREESLAEALFYTDVAKRNPYFKEGLKKRLLIGDDAAESTLIFNNAFVDMLVPAINSLLDGVSKNNQFSEYIQLALAEQLAFSGLCVAYDFEYAGKQRFNPIISKDFFWDINARRYDLQDSEYMGFVEYLSAPQILESAVLELNQQAKESIENYDKRIGNGFYDQGQVRSGQPVLTAMWRDTEPIWFGYVMDEFGVPMFCKINYIEPGESKPKYTDKDIVDPPKNERTDRIMRGKKKIRIDVDNIRFCRYVPWQASAQPITDKEKSIDIVLDYGLLPYQDTMYEEYRNVMYPFKAWTWSYIDGQVTSPIDDAINPQRFLNRVLSVTENQINNSGGAGLVYDSDLTDQSEEEIINNVNQSKPIKMNTRGRGVNNAVGTYNAGISPATYEMFNLIPAIKGIVQGSTGTNEAMRGEALGQDQLVGVTQALLQQGSILQAPFYHSLVMVFKQMYQAIANRGKRIYLDNDYELINTVGDWNAEILRSTKTAKIEDFRVYVEMSQNPKMLMRAADQQLMLLKQLNMIDDNRFANLYGRSTPELVAQSMREYAADKNILAREQAKAQAQQQEQMMQLAQQQEQQIQQQINDERQFTLLTLDKKSQNKIKEKTAAMATKALFDNMKAQPPKQ